MATTDQIEIVSCPNCGKANRVRLVASGVPHCGHCGKPLPWLVHGGQEAFHNAVEESPVPVLVDFWAPWCGPCRMVEPVVDQLSKEHAGRVKVVKINSDEAPALGERFNVRGIPTLILFDKGQVVDRVTGVPQNPNNALGTWLEGHLKSRRQ